MQSQVFFGSNWNKVRSFLPLEIEDWARETKALVRRREIKTGEMLLRILLTYSVGDSSLEKTVSWTSSEGWANMTATALFLRLRSSEAFVSKILAQMLEAPSSGRRRLRVVDATFLNGPAPVRTDFTLHVQYDPETGLPAGVDLMNGHGGESFKRHAFCAGDLVLGDRVYGHSRGIDIVLGQGADVLVRIAPHNIRLLEADHAKPSWKSMAAEIPSSGCKNFELLMPVPPEKTTTTPWKTSDAVRIHKVRVLGLRDSKGEVVWLFTNLSAEELPDTEAMESYRVRWQIELFFKRLKSKLNLDDLPSRDPTTARPWILLKLIAAILVLKLTDEAFSPWGCVPAQMEKPVEEGLRRANNPGTDTPRTRSDRVATAAEKGPPPAAPVLPLEA